MSRHRDVRNTNYDDEYAGYDDVYGHSVEDDYAISPSVEHFIFSRDHRQHAPLSHFMTEAIPEDQRESFSDTESEPLADSTSSFTCKIPLSDKDEAHLRSCIDSIRNIVGDTISDNCLSRAILDNDFDLERSIDAVFCQQETKKPVTLDISKPKKGPPNKDCKPNTNTIHSHTPALSQCVCGPHSIPTGSRLCRIHMIPDSNRVPQYHGNTRSPHVGPSNSHSKGKISLSYNTDSRKKSENASDLVVDNDRGVKKSDRMVKKSDYMVKKCDHMVKKSDRMVTPQTAAPLSSLISCINLNQTLSPLANLNDDLEDTLGLFLTPGNDLDSGSLMSRGISSLSLEVMEEASKLNFTDPSNVPSLSSLFSNNGQSGLGGPGGSDARTDDITDLLGDSLGFFGALDEARSDSLGVVISIPGEGENTDRLWESSFPETVRSPDELDLAILHDEIDCEIDWNSEGGPQTIASSNHPSPFTGPSPVPCTPSPTPPYAHGRNIGLRSASEFAVAIGHRFRPRKRKTSSSENSASSEDSGGSESSRENRFRSFSIGNQIANFERRFARHRSKIVPFDFSTPSPDDVILRKQEKAFSRNFQYQYKHRRHTTPEKTTVAVEVA